MIHHTVSLLSPPTELRSFKSTASVDTGSDVLSQSDDEDAVYEADGGVSRFNHKSSLDVTPAASQQPPILQSKDLTSEFAAEPDEGESVRILHAQRRKEFAIAMKAKDGEECLQCGS